MTLFARLRALVRPGLPEPIDDKQWRRLYRLGVSIPCILAALNVLTVVWFGRQNDPPFRRFLLMNVSGHALIVAISLWSLSAAGRRTQRALFYAVITLTQFTAICAMNMDEAIETCTVLTLISIAFFRTALDGIMGLHALLSASVLQVLLWLLV